MRETNNTDCLVSVTTEQGDPLLKIQVVPESRQIRVSLGGEPARVFDEWDLLELKRAVDTACRFSGYSGPAG